jgi:hypothetical protein
MNRRFALALVAGLSGTAMAMDGRGHLYVAEFNAFGRVHRFDRVAAGVRIWAPRAVQRRWS